MSMLSHRLRRVLVAAPSFFQKSFSLSRTSDFPSVSSLLPRSVVNHPTEFGRFPARLFSTTQYQYDPYTGEDSFTPDNEGCDFNHWLITMNFPKDNLPSREEMISIFEQTCAKGFDISLEEAKKKIYAICTTSYQGFQAKMTIAEVEKFRDLRGVQYIIPDSYVDVENKLYGGDKYENGVITPGPIPVPTKEGFGSLAKESTLGQEQAQRSLTPLDKGLTSGQVKVQESQTRPDERSFKPRQGTLALSQGSQMPSTKQGQAQVQGSQIPSFQGSFKRDQGFLPPRQGQAQGSEWPSFQGNSKQGQGTMSVGQGQARESQMPSVQRVYNQGQGTPIHGQGQESQIPSYHMGYSHGQGALAPPCQGLPRNYGHGALANYNQRPPQGNFIHGTHENYNQMGRGNYITQNGGNYGPAQGAGSPGFGHGYSGHGQGGQIHSDQMGYTQGPRALMPPYQGNYIQGTPNSYGQWAFVNYNQGQPQGNFPQGTPQNYNQGGQWNFINPQSGGNYGPAQFGYPQCHGNQMPQYQLSYNQGQGSPFFGQWQCQGCGMLSYHVSYSHGQGALAPLYQGNYNHGIPTSYGQGTSANFNQGIPVNYNQMGQGNYNPQSGQNCGSAHGEAREARKPRFGQGQNQTFQHEDQRNVAGDWSNNNNPTDPTETGKIPH